MAPRMTTLQESSRHLSSSSDTSNTPQMPHCEYIDGAPLDWSGRGTSHVDYHKSEVLPLTEGAFLGHGMNGGVYETTCNGIRLAWKRKYCRRKIGEREMREIEIIKKLSHRHIIRLVGTYTQGPFLGLLLWPIATCDLATLLEDVEWLQRREWVAFGSSVELPENWDDDEVDRQARLEALGVAFRNPLFSVRNSAVTLLKQTIGCIVGAVAYLHSSGIKHKDLKPSNILLSRDGLWLADFGTATDFSVLTSSVTDEGDRGTPKYYSPEVAKFAPSGRPADIFSLGCVLFEIMVMCEEAHKPGLSQKLRRSHDKSFQSNLDSIGRWLEAEDLSLESTATDDYLLGLVRWMMEEEAAMRPTADVVEQEILLINGLGLALCAKRVRQTRWDFYRPCCFPEERLDRGVGLPPSPEPVITIRVTYGKSYLMSNWEPYCTVYLEHTGGGLIESVHLFTVSALGGDSMRGSMLIPGPQNRINRKYHITFDSPPYQTRSMYGYATCAYIVLRSGYEWASPLAQILPKTNEKRMMPIIWEEAARDWKHTDYFDVRNSS